MRNSLKALALIALVSVFGPGIALAADGGMDPTKGMIAMAAGWVKDARWRPPWNRSAATRMRRTAFRRR